MAHRSNFEGGREGPGVDFVFRQRIGRKRFEERLEVPQDALAGELTERDEAQSGAYQRGACGVKIRSDCFFRRPAERAADGSESDGMMAGSFAALDRGEKIGGERLWQELAGDAQRLTAHLPGSFTQFSGGLHRFEARVESAAGGEIFRLACAPGAESKDGIGGSGRAGEKFAKKVFDAGGVANAALLNKRLKAKRVGVGSGGKQAVGKLQEAEEFISARVDGRVLWD